MQEVGGSIPPGSTTLRLRLRVAQPPRSKAKRARRSLEGEGGLYPQISISMSSASIIVGARSS
jgi:hypothetical protein